MGAHLEGEAPLDLPDGPEHGLQGLTVLRLQQDLRRGGHVGQVPCLGSPVNQLMACTRVAES